jgi:hypothetical protein
MLEELLAVNEYKWETLNQCVCNEPNLSIDTTQIRKENSHFSFNTLKFVFINIRSIKNKLEKLEVLTSILIDLDIIIVTESWLEDNEVPYFNLTGFNLIHAQKLSGRGGGVAIYIKDIWNCNILSKIEKSHSILAIEIIKTNYKATIIAIYNPHVSNTDNFLVDFENCLDSNTSTNPLIVAGDFNVDRLKPKNYQTRKVFDLCQLYGLIACNRIYPTRVTESTATLIDQIFVNDIALKYTVHNVACDISDHNLLILIVENSPPNTLKQKCKRNNIEKDSNRIETKMENINFRLVNRYFQRNLHSLNETDIDTCYSDLLNYINNGIKSSQVYPEKRKPNHTICNKSNTAPWLTSKLLLLIKRKDILFNKTKKYPHNHLIREEYIKLRNIITQEKRTLKSNYFGNKLLQAKNDSKKFWRTINEMITNKNENNKTKSNILSLSYNNQIIPSNDIPHVLNSYFSNIGNQLDLKIPKHNSNAIELNCLTSTSNPIHSFFLDPVTPKEIITYINSLKNKNNKSRDAISVNFLKKCKNSLALADFINQSFILGTVPKQLKTARVVPVFKKGDRTKPENYRPISILPVVSKLVEKSVKVRLLQFLNKKNFFYKHQYGFRKGSSTLSAAIDIITNLENYLDNNNLASAIILDLQKAFDTVNHKILLKKLESAGIRGQPLKWFENYLNCRTQYVNINGIDSTEQLVRCGVPQGSVLGPILFLIYINDISHLSLRGIPTLFADDTSVFYSSSHVEELIHNMEHDLKILKYWLQKNRLSINIAKTTFIIFRKPSSTIILPKKLAFQNEYIGRVASCKFLGLKMNEHLTWDDHVDDVLKGLTPLIGILYRFRNQLPVNYIKSLYYALIYSRLTYLVPIWGNCKKNKLKEIQTVQNKAIKSLYGYHHLTPTRTIYRDTQLMPFTLIKIFLSDLYMYNVINVGILNNLNITFNNAHHEHNTRQRDNLFVAHNKTHTYGNSGLKNTLYKNYNSLPLLVKQSKRKLEFKSKLKSYLWQCFNNEN